MLKEMFHSISSKTNSNELLDVQINIQSFLFYLKLFLSWNSKNVCKIRFEIENFKEMKCREISVFNGIEIWFKAHSGK